MPEMTQLVASQDLIRVRPDGVRETFTVEIGLPVPGTDSMPGFDRMPYVCPMRIIGVEKTPTVHVFYGRNTVEALQNSLSAAGVILSAMPFAEEFLDAGIPNMGFHVSPLHGIVNEVVLTEKQQFIINRIKARRLHETPKPVDGVLPMPRQKENTES